MRTRKSDRDLTPQQRRQQLIDILAMGAVYMPATVAVPPDPPTFPADEKLSESGQTRLDVSATMPLSVSTTASGSRNG